jgi:hypothetical protein
MSFRSVIDIGFKISVAFFIYNLISETISFSAQSFPLTKTGNSIFGRDFVNMYEYSYLFSTINFVEYFNQDFYNAHLLQKYELALGSRSLSYPPHILVFIWPLALFPYPWSFVFWSASGLAAVWLTLKTAGIQHFWKFGLILPAVATCLAAGQIGLFTGALMVSGLILRDKRPLLSGILFGVLTIKPQMGILVPFLLLYERRWSVIGAAVATTLLLVLCSVTMVGVEVWKQYFLQVVPIQNEVLTQWKGILLVMMPTAFVNARLAGYGDYAFYYQLLTTLITLVICLMAILKKLEATWINLALIIGTATAMPYFFSYDLVAMGIASLIIIERGSIYNQYDAFFLIFAIIFPVLIVLIAILHLLNVVTLPITSLLLVAMLAYCAFRRSPQKAPLPQ